MRLFHVSEESNIEVFKPRIPDRSDLDKSTGLVWAITEKCLPNFLTPRDCPRVTYHLNVNTTMNDKSIFFSNSDLKHVVAIENEWFEKMSNTTLYLYEFDTKDFYLQDQIAGYYVSEKSQTPIRKYVVNDLFEELFKRNIEVRVLPNLQDLGERVKQSSLNWSLCRMGSAKK